MKRSYIVPPVLAAAILGIASQSTLAQTTVFSDTFGNGSTVQSTAITPTANSTTYQWFQQGGTPTTPTIASGDLHLFGRTTSSSIAEVQALFSPTPLTLSSVGDSITATIVFTDTQNIFPAGSASTMNIGLFNSGGSAPVTGVRLDASGSGTGGAVGWNGYVGRIGGTGGVTSSIITRPPQGAGITNPNQSQDALFNGASGSSTFNNPTGSLIANSGGQFAAGLTGGSTYTLSYNITLSAAGTVTISDSLFDSGNNVLFSQTGSTSTSPITSFDAFAFGWRYNSTSAANSIDVSSFNVVDNIAPIPEPSAFALGGLAALGLARHLRRRRA
ncbi:MAG TPA: PEP-CTERM sorting domain-containing protein [Verrucomicrobiae bacterium]|nr:PEP-CTERM sorting domain-containing protein [Verrucomicrobiae bacterium]